MRMDTLLLGSALMGISKTVFSRGPYSIYSMSMCLQPWTPDFVLKDNIRRVLPIWVIFPKLPLHLWGEKSRGKIASAVGKPLVKDECTTKKLRVSYARVLVEVDINIRVNRGRKIEQKVEYEWHRTQLRIKSRWFWSSAA